MYSKLTSVSGEKTEVLGTETSGISDAGGDGRERNVFRYNARAKLITGSKDN